MMDDTDVEMLNAYGQELGLTDGLTLWELIESHRSLRDLNVKRQATWHEALADARKRGLERGRAQALEHEFVSREKLKAMTIKELSDLLNEED
jgi:hypothetical protein